MDALAVLLLIGFAVVLLIVMIGAIGPQGEGKGTKKKPCETDPSQLCPKQLFVGQHGGFRVEGQMRCCKVINQRRAMTESMSRLKPGVDYNGISVTPEFHRQVLSAKAEQDKLPPQVGPRL